MTQSGTGTRGLGRGTRGRGRWDVGHGTRGRRARDSETWDSER